MMKKIIAIVLSLLMLLSCVACSNQEKKEPSQEPDQEVTSKETEKTPSEISAEATVEKVELNVWIASTGNPEEDNLFKEWIEGYKTINPNVEFSYSFIPWGDYFTKLSTAIVGEVAPDLFMTGFGQIGSVNAMNALLPLNDYFGEDWDGWSDFSSGVLESGTADGKLCALLMPAARIYAYRKDIAEQQGVTADELVINSREDLINLAQKMTIKDDKGNIIMSGFEINTSVNGSEQPYGQWAQSYCDNGVPFWNEGALPNFNSEESVKALEDLYALYQSGVSLEYDPSNGSQTNGLNLGIATVASVLPSALPSLYSIYGEENIGVLDCNLNTIITGNFMAANAATKYPEIAADVMKYIFSAEALSDYQRVSNTYSGRQSLSEEFVEMDPNNQYVAAALDKAMPYGAGMNPYFTQMVTILRTAIEAVFAGADAKTTLDNAAAEYESAIAG